MELVNQTGVPADLIVTTVEDRRRAGLLVVKATFGVARGQLHLDTQDPLPVLEDDEETPLGVLPSDVQPPGRRAGFELMVLGAACAARPVEQMHVELTVGPRRHALLVSGDRQWLRHDDLAAPTPPVPFTRMPLTWSRAFGGTHEAWVDERARVPVQHLANVDGIGFDAYTATRDLFQGISRNEVRPEDFVQPLPNVEDPLDPVTRPEQAPIPKCWAPIPKGHGFIPSLIARWDRDAPHPYRVLGRAHPELTFAQAPVGQPIALRGCTAGEPLEFVFQSLGLEADYVIAGRTGTIAPTPQRMVLLPDEGRVLVTYDAYFTFHAEPEDERSLRLRKRS